MIAGVLQSDVADYDAWAEVFNANADLRIRHGATGHRVYRDGNTVLAIVNFPDAEAVAAFMADPALKERMKESGVVSPGITIWTETDVREY